MKICIIPARGGSKRIPKKNIKSFCGKPIIYWSIKAAISTDIFDKVIVSTDDYQIAEIAEKYGAEIPFMRPDSLSDDFTATIPVIKHAVNWVTNHIENLDYACCIYPTAPFIKPFYIKKGLEKLVDEKARFAFSVTSYAYPIQRALRINEKGRINMLEPNLFDKRSQDLEEVFHDAGQFYWGTKAAWENDEKIFTDESVPIFIPRYLVEDIDNIEDWKRAEIMSSALRQENL